MEIYKEVINMLEVLYSQNITVYASDIPATPGPPPRPQDGTVYSSIDTTEVVSIIGNEYIVYFPLRFFHFQQKVI